MLLSFYLPFSCLITNKKKFLNFISHLSFWNSVCEINSIVRNLENLLWHNGLHFSRANGPTFQKGKGFSFLLSNRLIMQFFGRKFILAFFKIRFLQSPKKDRLLSISGHWINQFSTPKVALYFV